MITLIENGRFKTLYEIERDYLVAMLQHYRGNKVKTAATLNVSVKTIYNKLARYWRRGEISTSQYDGREYDTRAETSDGSEMLRVFPGRDRPKKATPGIRHRLPLGNREP